MCLPRLTQAMDRQNRRLADETPSITILVWQLMNFPHRTHEPLETFEKLSWHRSGAARVKCTKDSSSTSGRTTLSHARSTLLWKLSRKAILHGG